MVDEDCIHALFPHRDDSGRPSYRRHQFEVIRDALEAFDSGIETVVIEAPTGSGKTDIAKTVAMYATRSFPEARKRATGAGDPEPVLAGHQAHMITSMKLLQDAYLKTGGEVVLLKGKSNYSCLCDPRDAVTILGSMDTDFTCRDAEVFFGPRGCGSRKCPYLGARDSARWSPLALHNFDSFLNQVSLGKIFPTPRAVITVDEAHNVEDKIINFAAVEVSASLLQSIGVKWQPLPSEDAVTPWLQSLSKDVAAVAAAAATELGNLRVIYQAANKPSDAKRLRQLSRVVSVCEDVMRRATRYLMSVDAKLDKPVRWVVDSDSDTVRLEPVHGGRFIRDALLKWGQKRLLLSATFLDGDGAYSRALRLSPTATKKLIVPSTFAADRRPVTKRYVGNLGYRSFESNSQALARELEKIVGENGGRRGVVHCTSYAMSEGLRTSMPGNGRLVWHGREDREAVVRKFLSGDHGPEAVLVGVGLTEGYDFAGDLCRFQVLIKIPYPYPSKRLKARAEVDPRHMDWRTCLTLVQSYGRGMRSADDHCQTYVLDDRFDRFIKTNVGQLPTWFLEAVR